MKYNIFILLIFEVCVNYFRVVVTIIPRTTILPYHSLPQFSKFDCLDTELAPHLRSDSFWDNRFLSAKECLEDSKFPTDSPDGGTNENELSKAVQPLHYLVTVCPDMEEPFEFNGSVEIRIRIEESTDSIELNMKELDIQSVSLWKFVGENSYRNKNSERLESSVRKPLFRRKNNKFKEYRNEILNKNESFQEFPLHNMSEDKENDFIIENGFTKNIRVTIVTMDEKLEKVIIQTFGNLQKNGIYKLKINYKGFASENLSGLYKTYHYDANGKQRKSLVTQFQVSEARKTFPCFDEPGFRSSFTIALCRQKKHKTISNMPKIGTVKRQEDDKVWDIFERTYPMPTYLVAFAILDDFNFKGCKYSLTPVRVWSPSHLLNMTEFACKATPPLMKFFESYFGVSYSLPKIDLVGIYDFQALGMENWGLVTFTMERLLLDPTSSNNLKAQHDVLDTISHEIIHQWFGNLVGPSKWSNLWLSEGFASYFSLLGVHHVRPEWDIIKDKILTVKHSVLIDDSSESTRALVVRTNSPKEHALMFDGISYGKGCFVVRMMMHFLGEETFRKGLHNYLIKMKYKSVSQEQLWKFLTEAGHKSGTLADSVTVEEIMKPWTLQEGHPVVTVKRMANGTLLLSQKRFYIYHEENLRAIRRSHQNPTGQPKWWIPLSISTKSNPNFGDTAPKYWLNDYNQSWALTQLDRDDSWYVLNVQQTGFFRVNYDSANWMALVDALMENHLVFDDVTRAQLIDDSFSLSFAGHLSYDIPLDMIMYIRKETSPFVLRAVYNNLKQFSPSANSPQDLQMQVTLMPLLIHHYPPNGFMNRSDELPFIRDTTNLLIKIVCRVHEPCINEARSVFSQWMYNTNKVVIDEDLVGTILAVGMGRSQEVEWDTLLGRFQSTSDVVEKERLLSYLTSTEQTKKLHRLLDVLSDEDLQSRSSHFLSLGMKKIAENPSTTKHAWQYLMEKWPQLSQLPRPLDYIASVTPYLRTHSQYEELKKFTEDVLILPAKEKNFVRKISRRVKSKINFESRKFDGLQSWLKRRRIYVV